MILANSILLDKVLHAMHLYMLILTNEYVLKLFRCCHICLLEVPVDFSTLSFAEGGIHMHDNYLQIRAYLYLNLDFLCARTQYIESTSYVVKSIKLCFAGVVIVFEHHLYAYIYSI